MTTIVQYPRPLPPNSSEAGDIQTSGNDHHNNKGGHLHCHVRKKRKRRSPKDHTVIKCRGIKHHNHKHDQHHHHSHDSDKEKDNHYVIGGDNKNGQDDGRTNAGDELAMYMRAKTIVFKASGLKPNTRYYPFFNDKFVGAYCSITDGLQTSNIVTNAIGDVTGNFYLPANTFLAGHHKFKLVDSVVVDSNSNTIPAPGYTEVQAEYSAVGVLKQQQTNITPETHDNTTTPIITPPPPPCPTAPPPPMVVTWTRSVTTKTTSPSSTNIKGISTNYNTGFKGSSTSNVKITVTIQSKTLPVGTTPSAGVNTATVTYGSWNAGTAKIDPNYKAPAQPYNDPLAQSFYIDSNKYPNGTFVTSIEVFFKKVDQSCPVTLELRTMENGSPGSTILPGGKVVKPGYSISSSANATIATKFKFDQPIFLQPNNEYCFVLKSTSIGYEAWASKFGAIDITGQTTTTGSTVVTIPATPPVYSNVSKVQTFSPAGTASFTVPDGVTSIKVTSIGGGGGGQQGWGNYSGSGGAGAGGGAGQTITTNITVTPAQVLSLVIGAGGAGGSGTPSGSGYGGTGPNGTKGADGGATYITGFTTTNAPGGVGGSKIAGTGNYDRSKPNGNWLGNNGSWWYGFVGANSSKGSGGAGGVVNTNGSAGTFGAGGGGGAASNYSPNDFQTNGGKGGDGFISLSYVQTTLVTAGTAETTQVVTTSNTSTGSLITEQPFGGVLFKSANDHSWTPEQLEDLKFNLYVAEFSIGTTGNLVFKPQKNTSLNVYYNTARNLLLSSLTTTADSGVVQITIPMHALSNNDFIFIQHMPSNTINGIDLSNLVGEFEVAYVDEDNITITALNSNTATISGPMISSDSTHEINTIPPVMPPTLSNDVVTVESNTNNNSPTTIALPPAELLPPIPPTELGEYSFTVYSNIQANEVMIDYLGTEVAGTGIKELIKMADGQSTAGTETPYLANDYLEIDKDGVFHSFGEPRMLATPKNEAEHATDLDDDISTKVNIQLDSLDKYVSPVVDINGMSIMIKTHVIDNQGDEIDTIAASTGAALSDYNDVAQNSEIGAGTGNAAAKYKSAIVQLKDSAKEISIFINANCPSPAIIDCYIRTSNDPTTHMDRPWNWVSLDGIFGTTFKHSPDKNTINEYYFDYTAAERFNTFDLKFVMRSSNNSIVPKIFSIRTMTIIDNA